MTATAALTIDQLRVVYGSHSALDDISLQVRPGEILGILGPNGAGKSTFVRQITGVEMPIFPKQRFQRGAADDATFKAVFPDNDQAYREAFAKTFGL